VPTTNPSAILSKSTIRANAVSFAHAFRSATSETSKRQLFWIRFFEVFGVAAEQVSAFEQIAKRASTGRHGWIDLLYPGQMGVEHKSAGEDLETAMSQLLDYYVSLTPSQRPWLLIACDFQHFYWCDLKVNQRGRFLLSELPDNLDLFWWIAGYNTPHERFENEEDANLKATELLAQLHDLLSENGYGVHETREWLTRILFCLFADDTGIWERAAFHAYIAVHTNPDGSDLGAKVGTIFQVLDTPPDRRPRVLGEELSAFTYINGDLFAERLPIPFCDLAMREALLSACTFNWATISPAIFGSMFQNVMTAAERRKLGAHYTTEQNILRTIGPLFLDDLEAELANADTKPKLRAFQQRLADLAFFDPACGCGNFLVVAYREVRRLEAEVVRRLRQRERREDQPALDIALEFKVRVNQFYGIELEEFPGKIARVALYLADHLANRQASTEFGKHFIRFPIPVAPNIVTGNALALDWSALLPSEKCNYLFGNPPFVGMALMSQKQKDDNRAVFATIDSKGLRSGRLDYVACWYAKTLVYAKGRDTRCAFVSTNSLTQGEQARSMGPLVERHGYLIDFAHTSFKWTSEAKGRAQVTVVIVGFSHGGKATRKRLFHYSNLRGAPTESIATNINWYLADGPSIYPGKRQKPFIPGLPRATQGSKPWDGGGLIVSPEDYPAVKLDPVAAKYLRPFRQTTEMLYNKERWCLWLEKATAHDLKQSHVIADRLEVVRQARTGCETPAVRRQASTPSLFSQMRQPTERYLALPEVSSENRDFIPACFYEAEVVAGNKLITIQGAPLWLFGILQSAMFMAWVRTIVGRLETRYSLAPDLAYNAFPFPGLDANSTARIEAAAQEVLGARACQSTSSLDELYGENSMPPALVRAHERLDREVDATYAPRKRFAGDADRLNALLARYLVLESAGQLDLDPASRRVVRASGRKRRTTSG
jgi:hypothetical protein